MPNIESAAKRMRQNVKLRASNRTRRADLRTITKKATKAIEGGELESARKQLPETLSALGKAARKGEIHKNKAARLTSRLTKRLNALETKSKA